MVYNNSNMVIWITIFYGLHNNEKILLKYINNSQSDWKQILVVEVEYNTGLKIIKRTFNRRNSMLLYS